MQSNRKTLITLQSLSYVSIQTVAIYEHTILTGTLHLCLLIPIMDYDDATLLNVAISHLRSKGVTSRCHTANSADNSFYAL